jgi:hypothetical protein
MKNINKDLIYLISIAILAILLFRSCGNANESKLEIARLEHNVKASQDTLRQYVTSNGNMAAEISAFKLDKKKDAAQLASLTEGYQKLRGDVIALAKTNAELILAGKTTPRIDRTTDTTGIIYISDSTIINSTNYTKLYVNAPYKIIGTYLTVDKAVYNVNTSLDILIRFEEYKGNLKVIAETPHKSVKFNSIQGALLAPQDLPKDLRMSLRREWGLGFSLTGGMGYNPVNARISPMIGVGVGINYTPKKLQIK